MRAVSISDRPVAYTIAGEPYFSDQESVQLALRESANAWWMDRGKVFFLLFSLRIGLTIKEACELATISQDQYKYFCQIHPEFSAIKARIELIPVMQAHYVLNAALYDDGTWKSKRLACAVARWLLHRKDPARYGSAQERLFWAKRGGMQEDWEPRPRTLTQEQVDAIADKVSAALTRNSSQK